MNEISKVEGGNVDARKLLHVSLILFGAYMILGFKWFYSLLFIDLMDEWWFYFTWPVYKYAVTFILLLVIPWCWWRKHSDQSLASMGWRWGHKKLGLILSIVGIAAILGVGLSAFSDPSLSAVYPIERVYVDPHFGSFNMGGFITFEILYIFLYYFAYEFFFRGFIGLPLLENSKTKGRWIVMLQVVLTTIVHWDRPTTELVAAFAVGFIYGLVAIKSKSIVYGLINHVGVGIVTNIACALVLQGIV
ncbi:MAG: CPBP family intramembrane glutamic endopeptidase [Promethearchaeota archaeon]